MRVLVLAASLLLGSTHAALGTSDEIQFDGDTYRLVASLERDGASLAEYVRSGESVDSWKQMLSVQSHPKASRVADVLTPYLQARKPLYALKPDLLSNSGSKHAEDVIVVLLLLAPDRSHYEYALSRVASEKGLPVRMVVFSKRIPFADNVDFTQVLAKRNDWITELFALKLFPTEAN